jgi:hypothetical protein
VWGGCMRPPGDPTAEASRLGRSRFGPHRVQPAPLAAFVSMCGSAAAAAAAAVAIGSPDAPLALLLALITRRWSAARTGMGVCVRLMAAAGPRVCGRVCWGGAAGYQGAGGARQGAHDTRPRT